MLSDNVMYIFSMSDFCIIRGVKELWRARSYGLQYDDIMTLAEIASEYESELDIAFYISKNNEIDFTTPSIQYLIDIAEMDHYL